MIIQMLMRVGVVLCLALAALLLAVDAREYPGISRPALRALAYGALPLLVVGAINLRALAVGAAWRVGALACNVALLVIALRMVRRGGPPFAWLLLGVGVLLVAGCAALLGSRGGHRPIQDGRYPI